MDKALELLTTITAAYGGFFFSLLIHETAHSAVAWLKGAAPSPISVSFLPYLYLPMSPKLDEGRYEALPSCDKVKILVAGLCSNLLIWVCVVVVLWIVGRSLPPFLYSFMLFLAVANLAEIASYATVGAVHPISDIKLILVELPQLHAVAIYVPSTMLCAFLLFLTARLFPVHTQLAYWVFFFAVFTLLCVSRIVLTTDWKQH